MKLGFLILAHDQPARLRRLCEVLTREPDHRVVIHFDRGAGEADRAAAAALEADFPGRVRVISRVRCVWGEWSLVQAVLDGLRVFAGDADAPDVIHLMSGAEFPLRPVADLVEFLRRHPDRDFIECRDITQRRWVKGGLSMERLRFYFPFNFRTHRKAFDRLVRWQRKLRIRRRMPLGLTPHMGSQWWTMRWSTCAKLLDYIAAHPQVPRFFRSTWIPDESFVQTVVAAIIPRQEIADLQLTFHHLTPAGRPYVFHDDHLPLLRRLPHFFARKLSPRADSLWAGLADPRERCRRLPGLRQLATVRDLLRDRIDANHEITGETPGYKPAADDEEDNKPAPPPVLGRRPVLLLLMETEALDEPAGRMMRADPACEWLGRPFAAKCIATPDAILERIGMTRHGWKLRDAFPAEFLAQLLAAVDQSVLPVATLAVHDDTLDPAALETQAGLIPLVVHHGRPRPHRVSRIAARLHAASPATAARAVHIDLAELPAVLRDLTHPIPNDH